MVFLQDFSSAVKTINPNTTDLNIGFLKTFQTWGRSSYCILQNVVGNWCCSYCKEFQWVVRHDCSCCVSSYNASTTLMSSSGSFESSSNTLCNWSERYEQTEQFPYEFCMRCSNRLDSGYYHNGHMWCLHHHLSFPLTTLAIAWMPAPELPTRCALWHQQ